MRCIKGDDCYRALDQDQYIIFYFLQHHGVTMSTNMIKILELLKKMILQKIIFTKLI